MWDYERVYHPACRCEWGSGRRSVSKSVTGSRQARLLLSLDDKELTSAPRWPRPKLNMSVEAGLGRTRLNGAWERDNELYAEGSLSQVELDLRNIARLQAVAGYRQSTADHKLAERRLKRSRIQAPAPGVILEVNTHAGGRVNLDAGAGPLLVMGSAALVARAVVSGDDVASGDAAVLPSVGQAVEIAVGEQVMNARVASVLPAGDGAGMVVTAATEGLLPPPGSAVEIRF